MTKCLEWQLEKKRKKCHLFPLYVCRSIFLEEQIFYFIFFLTHDICVVIFQETLVLANLCRICIWFNNNICLFKSGGSGSDVNSVILFINDQEPVPTTLFTKCQKKCKRASVAAAQTTSKNPRLCMTITRMGYFTNKILFTFFYICETAKKCHQHTV